MEYWLTWVIVLAIGLVIGFIVHAVMKFPQGISMLSTLLAGLIGSIIGAFIVVQYVPLSGIPDYTMRFVWGAIGAVVLSIISELLFAGTRRGHIVTS